MTTGGILGRTLAGRFRVTGFIGEGAMAAVYRGVQEEEPRDVALKIMHPHLVSDATFVGRFKREAKAASHIVHPNTVRILDTGVDGGLLYIAMELLGGQDLFETLVLERRLAEARAAHILVQVADALTAAHDKGVVHRDLKPENIMLLHDPDDPGREDVKVLDFGIAKILDWDQISLDGTGGAHNVLTGAGAVVGTPAYMSPEQCRGEPIDVRSDLYACGVLLYQLVSGRLPFHSENAMDLAIMHVRAPPIPLETVVPSVHPKLAEIVMKALAKWPAQRQQTAAELRDGLRAILPELSPSLLAVVTPPPPKAPTPAEAAPSPPVVDAGEQTDMSLPSVMPAESAASADLSPPAPSASSAVPVGVAVAVTGSSPAPIGSRTRKTPTPTARAEPLHAHATPAPLSLERGGWVGELWDRAGRISSWWLVPLALALGIALGVLAFLVSRGRGVIW